MDRVFVYGTLKKGQLRNPVMDNSHFVGNGWIRHHKLFNLGHYPGVLYDYDRDDNSIVHGEVYEVNDYMLKRLDQIEGRGYLYERMSVKVEMEDGSVLDSFYYIYLEPREGQKDLIPSGVWEDACVVA